MTHHKFMKIILTASCLIVGTAMALKAEDRTDRFQLSPNVTICDTIEQVIESLENDLTMVEGCGLTSRPMIVEAVKEDRVEINGITYYIMRYEFPFDMDRDGEIDRWWIQYGFYTSDPTAPKGVSL